MAALISGIQPAPVAAVPAGGSDRRYFGRGDVVRGATLSFGAKAVVEIDSLIQDCTLNLGEGTELVVGREGVLADCSIIGAGRITVHGHFFEGGSPGIVGPTDLVVSASGVVASSVRQSAPGTRFSFQRGSRLRVKIVKGSERDGRQEVSNP